LWPIAEIQIATPLTSRSGYWEVSTASGTAVYDDFELVVSFLARFGEVDSSAADNPRTE
jgi:hypothetical protein